MRYIAYYHGQRCKPARWSDWGGECLLYEELCERLATGGVRVTGR